MPVDLLAGDGNIDASQTLPKRNPGLIQRIARAVIKNDPGMGPQPQQQASTQSGAVGVGEKQSIFETYFDTQNDRLSVYADADEMDSMSEEASVAMDTIADNACTSEDGTMESFEIHTSDEKIKSLLGDACRVSDLHHKVYSIARNAIKFGDIFLEIVVNGDGEVVDIRQLPPKTMYRNEDSNGNLRLGKPIYDSDGVCRNTRGECAYEQRDPDNDNTLFAAFYPWQIIHGRFNHDGFSRYGRSYLRVSRIIWKKLHAEEEALIMGRLVRAMLKLAFYIDTTGQSKHQKMNTLREFQDTILTKTSLDGKREKPFSVLTDFFLAVEHIRYGGQTVESKTRIESIDPKNDGLTHIDDVMHFHRKFLATLRVPSAYMGFEVHVNNKGTVSMQDIQFIRFLRRLQQFLGQCLRQVFDLALILQGIEPSENEYEIRWPPLSTADEAAAADAFYKQAQGWALMLGTNSLNQTPVIDPEYVQKHGLEMTDEEIAELNLRLDALEAEDQKEAQAKADDDHAKQVDLLKQKAKLTPAPQVPPPFPGGIPSNGHQPPAPNTNAPKDHLPSTHDQRTDPVRVATGANTAKRVSQDRADAVRRMVSRVDGLTYPAFLRLEAEQATALQLADALAAPVSHNGNGHHKEVIDVITQNTEAVTGMTKSVIDVISRPVAPPTVTIEPGAIQITNETLPPPPPEPPQDAEVEYDEDGRIKGIKRKKRRE